MSKAPSTIEEALNRYWKALKNTHHTPDYYSFQIWMEERLDQIKKETCVPIHGLPMISSGSVFFLELSTLAKALGIEINAEGIKIVPGKFGEPIKGRSRLKAINKGKLLYSFLEKLQPRTRVMIVNLSQMVAGGAEQTLNSETAFQHKYRATFFAAIEKSDGYTATKMLGRFRETEHDEGEIDYLEATLLFRENRPREAIVCAQKLGQDNIDWPRAQMLMMECFALLGLSEHAFKFAPTGEVAIYPENFLDYICQLCISNSSSPEKVEKLATELLHEANLGGLVSKSSQVYSLWNRFSCELATRYVEISRDLRLRDSALAQTSLKRDSYEPNPDTNHDILEVRQLKSALRLDSRFSHLIDESWPPEDAYLQIVSNLINHGNSEPKDWLQGLKVMWVIGDKDSFVDNVLRNLDVFITYPKYIGLGEVLRHGAFEARVSGRNEDAKLIERQLSDLFEPSDELVSTSDVMDESILRVLSSMAKLAFQASNVDLRQAMAERNTLRDAGMISLGFFRILELEYNNRLILEAFSNDDIRELQEVWDRLTAVANSSKKKRATETWKQLIASISRGVNQGKGLELGSLEILLGKTASEDGFDAELKSIVRVRFFSQLNDLGVTAFWSGDLRLAISTEVRERFRNPPAHTRFLDLETAIECKEHVVKALEKFNGYFTARDHKVTDH